MTFSRIESVKRSSMIQSLLLVFVFEILTYKKSSIWIPYKTFRITFLGLRHIIGNNGYLKPSLSFLFIWKFETKLVMLMRKIPPSFLNHPTLSFEKNTSFGEAHKQCNC